VPLKSVKRMSAFPSGFVVSTIFSKRKKITRNVCFVSPQFINEIVQGVVFQAEKRVEDKLFAKEVFTEILEKAEKHIEIEEIARSVFKEMSGKSGGGGESQDLNLLNFTVKNIGSALSNMEKEVKMLKKHEKDAENYILFVEKKLNESNVKVRQLEGCLSSTCNELRAFTNDVVTLKATNSVLLSRIKLLERA
jgi:hypothetical protein